MKKVHRKNILEFAKEERPGLLFIGQLLPTVS